jgi:hypothetical protein
MPSVQQTVSALATAPAEGAALQVISAQVHSQQSLRMAYLPDHGRFPFCHVEAQVRSSGNYAQTTD